jgi:lipoate-protein ligase A
MTAVWRFIDSGRCDAAFNMALDEALVTSVRQHASPPVLRFYGWSTPSVTLGRFQNISDIDSAFCCGQGVKVVRRPTGGRAVLHGEGLTYSFSAGTAFPQFSKGLLTSYRSISEAFCLAFRSLGLAVEAKNSREKRAVLTKSPLCFSSGSYAELMVSGTKIAGAAQRRWPDAFLQQGSLPFRQNRETEKKIFKSAPAESDSSVSGLKDFFPDLDEAGLKKALGQSFEALFGVRFEVSEPAPAETEQALLLLERKYLQDSWTYQR